MTKTVPRFLTAYDCANRKHAPAGSKYELTYGYTINKHGQKVLAVNGETNVYEKIQEQLEESKIENILARAAAGDNSVFRPNGIYIDTTEMPNNLIEARQQMQQLENVWNGLPKEIREKYNYDVEMFIGKAGSEEWLKDMRLLNNVPKEEVKEVLQENKEEVKTNES